MKNFYSALSLLTSKSNGILRTGNALILCFLVMASQNLAAQCASAPGAGNITGNVPFGNPINWANPNRVEISDDDYAWAKMDPGDTTKYLMVRDFGFLIPAAASIVGIQSVVEKSAQLGAMATDGSVRLMKAGVITGQDKATGVTWSKLDQVSIYGGPADLWGQTWTPADIMDPGFGMVISASSYGGPNAQRVRIDYIGIIIYYYGGTGCLLSVALDAFDAEVGADGRVIAQWQTRSETNNDFFTLEKSRDGKSFDLVEMVPGAGNSFNVNTYTSVDENPIPGVSFYRLMQTDYDGNTSYSKVISVSTSASDSPEILIYPNPASSSLNISYSGASSNSYFALYDVKGKMVKEIRPQAQDSYLNLDVNALPRGIYLLKYSTSGGSKSQRVILQ
ncbi:MAG: T9SS type A sorting domain-containing protein [Bacteroidia bacterium]|nr:T9SS type A sorting domain-containing protein [Bacteroidia bacterium]